MSQKATYALPVTGPLDRAWLKILRDAITRVPGCEHGAGAGQLCYVCDHALIRQERELEELRREG